jgi:proline dehydrogenase
MTLPSGVLRPAILRVAHHPWMRRLVTGTRPGRAVATRFVAGETLEEALAVVADLDRKRTAAMLNHLGENVTSLELAGAASDAYRDAITSLAATPELDAAISVKPTQLGLDVSVEACWERLAPVLDAAAEAHQFLMIDMEDHSTVDATLELLHRAHARYSSVGVALQSYLRRTEHDAFALPPGCRVRLVKGAYLEPPELVLPDKAAVDRSFGRLFVTLLRRGHAIDVATHDHALIQRIRRLVDATEDGWARVEFQMLYGVRRDLQARLAGDGYPLRVFVPYGSEWYPYLTRRMAERPANLWFFLSNLVRIG